MWIVIPRCLQIISAFQKCHQGRSASAQEDVNNKTEAGLSSRLVILYLSNEYTYILGIEQISGMLNNSNAASLVMILMAGNDARKRISL